MAYGIARGLRVEQISGDYVEKDINRWLADNEDADVLDIKFSASAAEDNWNAEALIIYRKES